LHQCKISRGAKSYSDNANIKHEFFDLYSKEVEDNTEYLIFDPNIQKVKNAIYNIKKQIIIQLLSSAILDSMIAENHARSTSMESTKDEAQQIMYQLNKQMAKERQARITGELIELITSFTSLNQAV
jgi:F0F1-type ATP synthase gamma subunit